MIRPCTKVSVKKFCNPSERYKGSFSNQEGPTNHIKASEKVYLLDDFSLLGSHWDPLTKKNANLHDAHSCCVTLGTFTARIFIL